MDKKNFNQLSRKMLHLIMTLLIYGGETKGTKCPESCTCIQTLVLPVNDSRELVNLDEDNITRTSFVQHLYSYKNILNSVGINEAEYTSEIFENSNNKSFSRNQTRSLKCAKNLKENVKNIFAHNFSLEPVKTYQREDAAEIKTKRLKFNSINTEKFPFNVNGEQKVEVLNESSSKGVLTETKRNKEIFTYQITCNELSDFKSSRLQYFPNFTTELIIRQTYFESFNSFQQILKDSSIKLTCLTHLTISDSVINQKPIKKYFSNPKLSYKVGKANKDNNNSRSKEFLPFASLQNPKLRSKQEPELMAKEKCKNLQVLNLVNNSIRYLPRDVFQPFQNLQILNLSTNLIELVDDELFGSLINLLHLDIHDNRLRSLNELMFKNLTKLVFLDVSQNSISNVAPSTFQYLISLNILNLANNPLFEKEEAVILLGSGRGLQIINVSKTGMKQIPGTLERSVRVLNLMGNRLLSIRCGDLDSYFLLSYLNLRDNKINYVEDDALGRLEFLTNLQISFNNLFQIPKSLPNNLEILNLSYNNIQNITNSDFVNLSLLKELAISYNQISNIESNAFNNLIRLKTLDLSRNPILILPNIYSLARLTNLNLSYFTNIPGNFIIKYKQFPVRSPENIKKLNLESSPVLTKIFLDDTKTLETFRSLTDLDIRFSNLTTIRKDIFSLLPNLKRIKVQGNPWHCGKEILILSEWLRNHKREDADEEEHEANAAHCSTPSRLYKISLITLKEKNFESDQDKRDNQLMNRNNTSYDEFKGKNSLKVESKILRPKNFSSENGIKLRNFSEKKNSSKKVQTFESEKYDNNNNNNNNNNNSSSSSSSSISSKSSTNGGGGDNVEQSLNQSRKKGDPKGENCCEKFQKKVDVEKFEKNSRVLNERALTKGGSRTENGSMLEREDNNTADADGVEENNLFDSKKTQVPGRILKKAEAVTAKDAIFLNKDYNSHISFFILSSIGLIIMATLTFTSVYFSRARRSSNYQRQNQDIEVCSISSISNELW